MIEVKIIEIKDEKIKLSMKWNIQNISIPVYDLKKSIDFYESLLGKLCNKDVEFLNYSYLGKSVFFGNRGVGIRLFELNSHIETNRMIQSNRSFPTIRLENFQEIYYRLIKKKGFSWRDEFSQFALKKSTQPRAHGEKYRIAVSPWYPPYQPFSGIDRAMASWHGIEGRKPDFAKTQGLKIRFAGLGGQIIERLGASVTMLPGGEIFQALEKGAIDATEFALPIVDQALGFSDVAKYNYYPGWHQPFTSSHLVINLDTWESLTKSDKAIIEMGCTAAVTRNLAHAEAVQGEIIANFDQVGVSAERLPLNLLK